MFEHNDAAKTEGWQYLENLATAYWYSEALFAALELDIFSALAQHNSLPDIAAASSCKPAELERLLLTLKSLKLVRQDNNGWQNGEAASRYLQRHSGAYMGDFLLYRRYLQRPWQQLTARLSTRPLPDRLSPTNDYPTRTLHYVRALDALACRKAEEIASILSAADLQPPVLDIGGGAASLSRRLLRDIPAGRAVLLDLEEVLTAAAVLYPHADQWTGIEKRAGDFREINFSERFGTILMANFLHIYEADEVRHLLSKAASLLLPAGVIIIHDYFPDRPSPALAKGALYDLNMMLNTYAGRCHASAEIAAWLKDAGFHDVEIQDLASDSSVITATGTTGAVNRSKN